MSDFHSQVLPGCLLSLETFMSPKKTRKSPLINPMKQPGTHA
jgi:hypothetical protein